MATETLKQDNSVNESAIGNFISKIKEIVQNLKEKLHELFGIKTETKKELENLEKEILGISDSELSNQEIASNESAIFNTLIKNNKVKNLFEWYNDASISQEDKDAEKNNILKILEKEANDDSDANNGDLETSELDIVYNYCENKQKILDSVLNDDEIKNLNPTPSKKDILSKYNEISSKDSGTVRKEDIITALKEQQSSLGAESKE